MYFRYFMAAIVAVALFVGGAVVGQTRAFPYAYVVRLEQAVFGRNLAFNSIYDVLDAIYATRPKAGIVMVGDSHVQFGDWSRLLGRNDVVNFGIAGERSAQLKTRLERYDILADAIVIAVGTNDVGNMTTSESDDSFRAIIAAAEKKARKVIVLAPPPAAAAGHNTKVGVLRELQRQACQAPCAFLDLTESLSAGGAVSPELVVDGVHFNERGYQLIAKALAAKLAE